MDAQACLNSGYRIHSANPAPQETKNSALRKSTIYIDGNAANLLLNFTADQDILHLKELIAMPNIKPISDLRNYSEVLRDVAVGAPVFLTKNGRGRYAIVDMQDYEKTQATLKLMNELAKGRRSGETEGWLTPDDMRAHFRARAREE